MRPIGRAEAAEGAHQFRVRARETLAAPQPEPCEDADCLGPARIALSVGVSLFDDTMDPERFLQIVEQNMHNAKCAGRNQV